MAILRRATEKLRNAGIKDITVVKNSWGINLHDPQLTIYTSICHETAKQAVEAAMAGERPKPLNRSLP